MPETIAVLCSDVHLSHSPPLARSGEPDWYDAMARVLLELEDLSETDNGVVPIVCGGDVFDRWNSPPQLINFALDRLPEMFSVAGQHDLPYHSWEEREKSAFWTLAKSRKIDVLEEDARDLELAFGLGIRGFSWGQEPSNDGVDRWTAGVKLLVAHRFVWVNVVDQPRNVAYERDDNHLKTVTGRLEGYDAALFGDNHAGFSTVDQSGCRVFNAGTLMRRRANEKNYAPMVGLLLEDGTVEPHRLDTSKDVFCDAEPVREAEQVMLNMDAFLDELQKLGETGLNFRRAVEAAMDREQVSRAVRRVILEAMEKGE